MMERKRYQSRVVEVEAVEFEDSFKVFLPDGHVAFEPKDKFLAKYELHEQFVPCSADGPATGELCVEFRPSEPLAPVSDDAGAGQSEQLEPKAPSDPLQPVEPLSPPTAPTAKPEETQI